MTIFDTVPLDQLRTRTSEKWRHYPADVLPLFVAEMDVPQAEPVVRAVTDAVRRGDTGYPSGSGFAEAVAAFAADRWDWAVDVASTRLVPDVMLGVVELLRLVTDPGDAVVINPPVYPPFAAFVAYADRRVVNAPLGPDDRLDLEVLEAAFAQATGTGGRAAYLLCHPHNPTGTLHTAEELRAVGALAARYGVRVLADEIHAPIVLGRDARFVPTTTQIPDAIALHSGSKAFNLAGLRVAVAVPGPDAAADLARLPEVVAHGVSHLAVIAQQTAYRECGAWLDDVLDGLRQNQALAARLLGAQVPAAGWSPPEATYFAWLDLRAVEAVRAGADPAALALDRGRVALNPGPTFGAGGVGHVRLNLAASTATLTDAVARLRAGLGAVATVS
ncbi:MalY/PatB family protein [Cellulomonas fengjieae]|uniref:cysteine-S-conjugate beta-lyase n=1 Tax=Cellulomonas fengjieae TaxID=2819978 RepID=A0ABS3SHT1_9CELL|nr:aminotransferase class I/II-fold pyridoxal phosphate-dependent enzyme [Cellulomonas fengjieae]MBO3085308.1 aminotransferase class I/II-fold pyridoxal phosphate-dependent enzyme [Cellulomonas fengjieae]QVI66133.1 aminotransferase class I/II-fold pyridoxal phosphate-dependent enzyme [Cellulomonas fengjieae]